MFCIYFYYSTPQIAYSILYRFKEKNIFFHFKGNLLPLQEINKRTSKMLLRNPINYIFYH